MRKGPKTKNTKYLLSKNLCKYRRNEESFIKHCYICFACFHKYIARYRRVGTVPCFVHNSPSPEPIAMPSTECSRIICWINEYNTESGFLDSRNQASFDRQNNGPPKISLPSLPSLVFLA